MKRLLVVSALILLVSSFSYAQDYKKFKVGLGLGYAMAGGSGSSGGVIVTFEPAYRIQDNLSIGLRCEAAALTRGFSSSLPAGGSVSVAAIGSYTLNGQYYFGSGSSFRPFAGAGLGLYSMAAVSVDTGSGSGSTTAAAAESKFGFYPRVGFDFHHFSMSADYNLLPSTKAGTSDIKNSYLGIRFGFFFGGGKK